ncbi:hypothetical protein MUDAN_BIHEEGNE_01574 [Lactiplantibacillus mudanjiangensis]|uniref:Uncharacterized protein n=1 Tax=Lactiplantibacillus mudanjiangensis TaxID=1296538 RepID=A0A660E9L8_9LACO|nr:hypothetical protein MUDAN_BIHEEGNE_01574 [Lactiplantibacillus mudanjiangensis]VDG25748.1 hypothetical protein MUDAN_IGPPGNFN_03423 [Lactiplantibacillus mudanjiangensis]VDG29760.1 hypothetical protein MUDAN_MDHGFNIF_01296 [Lactiplantibacillus mudanjiangensis]VDG31278.1 hypothetical protein MUDAN_DOGOELCO_00780 [Lactiplantibacillus mudanjiangensis]
MVPAVRTSLVRVAFPVLRCGRLLRLAVWARLKSEVEARILGWNRSPQQAESLADVGG